MRRAAAAAAEGLPRYGGPALYAGRPRAARLGALREAPARSLAGLSERDLSHLWEGQRFPPEALSTTYGERLRVVYRGRKGRGPGPDFRDAVIEAGGRSLRGDVELHLRASDFRRHGHHLDPAYDGLALHLVFWADEAETRLAGGGSVTVAALGSWVERRSQEIRGWLERPALWSEPCRGAPERMGGEAIGATLERLGDLRFRLRARGFRGAIAAGEGEAALWGALLEALGYGGNREAFAALARRLPWPELAAGLRGVRADGRSAEAGSLLERAARGPPPLAWRVAAARPGNHPARRLRAAALLAAGWAERGPAPALRGLLDAAPGEAVSALTVRERGTALVGRGRALELLTNAVLPFFAAAGGEGGERALALYRALPRPVAYGSVRHLDEAVGGAVRVDGRRQQGMLFLLRNYCSRGRCGTCPLS
ncbi:MAG: DUF2851 family protein [Dehalococcoidia bacterium]